MERRRIETPSPQVRRYGPKGRITRNGHFVSGRRIGTPPARQVAEEALLAVLLVGTGGHGSMRTPGLRMPFGSSRFFTARIDSANSSGR